MTHSKHLRPITPQALVKLASVVHRRLNYHVGPDGTASIDSGPDVLFLAWLDQFIMRIVEKADVPFRINVKERRALAYQQGPYADWHSPAVEKTPVRKAMPNPLCQVPDHLAIRLKALANATSHPGAAQLRVAPHIRLLLDVFLDDPLSRYPDDLVVRPNVRVDDTGRVMADVLNDFVAKVRCTMVAEHFVRRQRHAWTLGSRETLENLHAYLDGLFARNRSVMVLHLQLFHAKERVSLISAKDENQHRELLHRDLRALRACRTVFFDRMRKKTALFTREPHYVWSILPSLRGGHELHLTLLFDTAALRQVLDDIRAGAELTGTAPKDLADLVGKYWVEVATKGEGGYVRGDRSPWLYRSDWVHGEIKPGDGKRRDMLKETLGHLAMRRVLVRLKDEPPGPYFGMSEREPRGERRPPKGKSVGAKSRLEAWVSLQKDSVQST